MPYRPTAAQEAARLQAEQRMYEKVGYSSLEVTPTQADPQGLREPIGWDQERRQRLGDILDAAQVIGSEMRWRGDAPNATIGTATWTKHGRKFGAGRRDVHRTPVTNGWIAGESTGKAKAGVAVDEHGRLVLWQSSADYHGLEERDALKNQAADPDAPQERYLVDATVNYWQQPGYSRKKGPQHELNGHYIQVLSHPGEAEHMQMPLEHVEQALARFAIANSIQI